jgi:hypothetical protein
MNSLSLTTLRAQLAGHALMLAAIRVQLALKANFNPAQLRVPAGQPGGGQWTRDGDVSLHPVADRPPPLRRMHPDGTYERDQIARGSLDYWRRQTTDRIVDSLRPGADQELIVEADGTVWQGNTRIKVLQERGYDVDSLPRTPRSTDPKSGPRQRGGRGGGGIGGGGIFPSVRVKPRM